MFHGIGTNVKTGHSTEDTKVVHTHTHSHTHTHITHTHTHTLLTPTHTILKHAQTPLSTLYPPTQYSNTHTNTHTVHSHPHPHVQCAESAYSNSPCLWFQTMVIIFVPTVINYHDRESSPSHLCSCIFLNFYERRDRISTDSKHIPMTLPFKTRTPLTSKATVAYHHHPRIER